MLSGQTNTCTCTVYLLQIIWTTTWGFYINWLHKCTFLIYKGIWSYQIHKKCLRIYIYIDIWEYEVILFLADLWRLSGEKWSSIWLMDRCPFYTFWWGPISSFPGIVPEDDVLLAPKWRQKQYKNWRQSDVPVIVINSKNLLGFTWNCMESVFGIDFVRMWYIFFWGYMVTFCMRL